MPLISENDMPSPRLELRWEKTGETWEQRECAYNIVLPLRDTDIRCEDERGVKVRATLTLEIGRTRVEGGFKYLFQPNEKDGDQIDTPYRDGAHARWDSAALRGRAILRWVINIRSIFENAM
jgi:hypothetical protein